MIDRASSPRAMAFCLVLSLAAFASTGAVAGGPSITACWEGWYASDAHASNRCVNVGVNNENGTCNFHATCKTDAWTSQNRETKTTNWNGTPDYASSMTVCDGEVKPSPC